MLVDKNCFCVFNQSLMRKNKYTQGARGNTCFFFIATSRGFKIKILSGKVLQTEMNIYDLLT